MHRLGLAFVVLAAACGGGGDSKVDGGGGDGDGGAGDGSASAPVTVTIHDRNGAAVAGARVHFQNPDSTLVTSVDTDTSGVASAVMPNGGYVTAVNPFATIDTDPNEVDIRTFAGVKGGDALMLDEKTVVSTVTVTGGHDTPNENMGYVATYAFTTPCAASVSSNGPASVQMMIDGNCRPTTDVFQTDYDVNGISPMKWGYLADVPVTGSTIDASSISMTNDFATKSYAYTNNPFGNNLRFFQEYVSAKGIVFKLPGALVEPTLPVPQIPDTTDLLHVYGHGTVSTLATGAWTAGFITSQSVDVEGGLLRKALARPTYDIANHRLVWTEAATGLAPDWGFATVSGFRDGPLHVTWTIAAAASGAAVQFPTLPNEGTDYNWSATDTPAYEKLTLGKTPGGYDAIRAALLDLPNIASPRVMFGGVTSGTYALQIFDDPPQNAHGKE